MPRPTRSGLKVLAIGVLGSILLLSLYVLSSGPALRLTVHGNLPPPVYHTVYAPLFWVTERWPEADETLARYELWCIPEELW
jgi:hypothetical protein